MMPAKKQIRPRQQRFLSLLAALCLLLISVASAMPAQANDPYGTPELSGTSWFGGHGVTVYSNGDYGHVSGDYNYVTVNGQSVNVGMKWQCVELAQRFYTVQGWHSGLFPGVNGAADIWGAAAKMNMTTQANGSITSIVPGDMIIHGTNDNFSPGYGHVAIVDYMSADGTTVHAVQQNAPATTQYSLNNGTLTGGSGSDIKGIVHSPNNTNAGNGGGSGGGTTQTYVPSNPKPVTYMVNGTPYMDVYATAGNGGIFRNTWDGTSWNHYGYVPISCCFTRNPTVVTYTVGGTPYFDVFATAGNNGDIFRNTWDGTAWNHYGYAPIGTGHSFKNFDPAVVTYMVGTTQYIDVYATATDGGIYRNTWNGSSWSGYTGVSCCFDRNPTAVAYTVGGTQYVDVYATAGSNGDVYRNTWNGSSWNHYSYAPIGGGLSFKNFDPAVVTYMVGGTSYIDVYATATNGGIYRNTWNGTTWSGYTGVSCCFVRNPTAIAYTVGTTQYIDVYALAGSNGGIFRNTWDGSSWNHYGYAPIGTGFGSDPAVVTFPQWSTTWISVFGTSSNQAIYNNSWTGSYWTGFGYVDCCFEHTTP